MAIKPNQGWSHHILAMSEVGRIISDRPHWNEEATIVLLSIERIVPLPGTLLEVGNC